MKWRFFTFFLCLQLPLLAQSLSCAVPKNVVSTMAPLFSEKIAYTKLKVHIKSYANNKKALEALQEKKVKFAVVRSDILWQLHKEAFKSTHLKDTYIGISILPYFANLYLVQSNEYYDIDVEDLKNKDVSTGVLGEENGYLLKSLLKLTQTEYKVHYKSIAYVNSIKSIEHNTLDAFFGFLPSSYENDSFHFQTIFSNKSTAFMEKMGCYKVDYDGIHVPYMLIADKNATDEEIENMIYRLEEKNIFSAQTDERYGPVNRYVLQHLEQVQLALNAQAAKVASQKRDESIKAPMVVSKTCLKYHYGFLDLLRRKPGLKKKLRYIKNKRPSHYKQAKEYLRNIEMVLLNIDAEKHTCDKSILEEKTRKFKSIERSVKALAR